MAGKDGTELVVGANGRVRVAEMTDTVPTSATSTLPAGWIDLGYVSEDGVTFSDEIEKKRVTAWNARRPIRMIPGNATTTVAFGLMQWNAATSRFALGGGSTDPNGSQSVYTPDRDSDDFRQLCVDWADGGLGAGAVKNYRLYFPRGIVGGSIELALTQTDETTLPVTFESMPDESDSSVVDEPYLLFTNDPAFAEGS